MRFIKHFSEIDHTDLPRVGGKALNLGKLTRAGFPVPNGFCVTTAAYRLSVEGLSEQNESSVRAIEVSPELVTEIRTALEKLQATTVAVRSSATAEDLAEASFAGQQDTFLNVTSDELLDALKACWASLWSERAIAYRQTQKITDEGLAMGVVIQEMCEADVSGVLFTVAPFNENATIIESNWGLGESVVSGAITPDSFHVSRKTGDILERNIATKCEMVTAAGVSEVPATQQDVPSLTDAQLQELAQLGMRVETYYGQPMDIEWALADGQFVLLQSRYITTSPKSITHREPELAPTRRKETATHREPELAPTRRKETATHREPELAPTRRKETATHREPEPAPTRRKETATHREPELAPTRRKETATHREPEPAPTRRKETATHREPEPAPTRRKETATHREPELAPTRRKETATHREPELAPTRRKEAVEKIRQEEIQRLEARAEKQGTVWCHHNLAEVLPTPLPMTWEMMKKFMSGAGGLGKAYRDLGFYPSERVNHEGILDLICGRIYVSLNREAELHFEGFPFAHDFNALKQDPQAAMYAQAQTDITRSNASFWVKLPLHIVRMSRAEMRLRQYRSDFARLLIEEIFPAFQREVEAERHLSYSDLTDAELVTKFEEWRAKTLDDFAPKALTATLLAGFSLQRLEAALLKCLSETEAKILASRLMSGIAGNLTVETNGKLREVATGDLSLTDFLKDYGHRAVNEFELAQPRWREDTTYLEQIVASLRSVGGICNPDPLKAQREHRESAEKELAVHLENKTGLRKQVEQELDFTRRYMPFRETAKFYLMLGYEQIRRALLELDRRYHLDGGVFYLVPDELGRLIDGEVFSDIITMRKMKRELMLQIEVPDVIFSDALGQIGTLTPLKAVDTLTGVGVSAGVATGQARVLLKPTDVRPSDRNYILVCPSTDPAWTPLFLHAAGLVMERGGILSHGAVVAREYGVPAVANIPNVTRRIVDGQMLRVDGNQGTISII